MIKKGTFILIIIILFTITISSAALSDISTHWGKTYIEALVQKKCITGYPDGSFKPNGTIKIGEFVKILVGALGYTQIENNPSGHWAENYVAKAVDLDLISSREWQTDCKDYNQNITRGQMARMISRAMTESFTDLAAYEKQIKDVSAIPTDQKEAVVKMYRAGIITGYTDGSFKAQSTATRAEASTMLMRYLDSSLRIMPELSSGIWTDAEFEAFVNKNPEAVKYCSTRFFYIKDKKVVFKKGEAGLTKDSTPPETNFPGLNAVIYRGAKQLIWDAYQNGDYASLGYVVAMNMNLVGFNYYESQLMGEAMVHPGNFKVSIEVEPVNPSDWPELSGMTKKVKIYWKLIAFYGAEDDALYTEEQMHALNYMLPKYNQVCKTFVKTIYNTSSDEIYNYMFNQYQKGLQPADLKVIDGVEIKTLKDEGAVYRCYTSY